MGALFARLPLILVVAAAALAGVQLAQMAAVAAQPGPSAATILAMAFGVLVQVSQLLALAALVHYARLIAGAAARA